MSWQQITRQNTLIDDFYTVLTSHSAYVNQKKDVLWRIIEDRGGEIWLFNNGSYQIPLSVAVHPVDGRLKILSGLPYGDFVPEQAMAETWKKVREILDRKSIRQFYVSCKKDYGDAELNEYILTLEEICWEHVITKPYQFVSFDRFEFDRDPARKTEDPQMRGPKFSRLQDRIAGRV